MPSKENPHHNANELGETIRKLRLGQIQAINGHTWSQEDLAVAIDSDKSHINRLEKGRQLPNPKTLNRICNVLNVSWSTRKRLLSLAGQLATLPTPGEEELQRVVQRIEPHLDAVRYAAALEDMENTVWAVNDIEAFSFYGYPTKEKFMDECQGLSFIELLLTPFFHEWFQRIIVDYGRYFRRQVLRFADIYLKYQQLPEYQNLLRHFLQREEFRKVWQTVQESHEQEDEIDFLNHQVVDIDHPQLGRYRVQLWHATLASDDRFKLVSHIPDDASTMQMFDNLYQHYQKKQ